MSVVTAVADVISSRPVAKPGRGPELLAALVAATELLDEVPGALHQLGGDQEDELMTALLRLQGRSAQVGTIVAADAVDRGVLNSSNAANTAQWIAGRLPSGVPIEPTRTRAMARVADACQHRKNTVIAAALLDGSCAVESARTALTEADKVGPVIPTAERDEVLSWFLQMDPAQGSGGLTKLTRAIIARFAPDELSTDDEKLEHTESLTWSTTPTGMLRMVAHLAPANAAVVKDAINAKSAPRPAKPADTAGKSEGAERRLEEPVRNERVSRKGARDERLEVPTVAGQSVRDERSPGKRRADALMDLLGAGARTATGDGVQASAATVLLTIGLETLTKGHGGATTTDGDTIDAGAARRFACTADLIPVVLGGPSQPLDVGRRERLATRAIRAAVIIRDRGCTFPGCDRPPGFCEVHHVTPWWAGGQTSLADSALLCGRHHQTVHRQGYTADVRPDGVHWNLTPGLMPGHGTPAA